MAGAGPVAWLAGPEEAADVARLLIAFRDHHRQDWPPDEVFVDGVTRLMDDPDTEYVLGAVRSDAGPAGVVQLRFRYGIWRAGHDCLVEDVFVDGPARGSGLGRTMMELATARALERGARRMELDTNETNAAAIALYESLGFANRTDAYPGRDLYFRRHLPA